MILYVVVNLSTLLYEVSDMRNMFRHLSSKAPLFLIGLSLFTIFAVSRPVEVKARALEGDVYTHEVNNVDTIVLTGNMNLHIDSDISINYLDLTSYNVTITGDENYTFTVKRIYGTGSGSMIINSGTISSTEWFEVKSLEVNGGTINVNTPNSNGIRADDITINDGIVTAKGGTGSGIYGKKITITGGKVDAEGKYNGLNAWDGNIRISGANTTVKAKTNSPTNYYFAIKASGTVFIDDPLAVTTPNGGGISGDGKFIATVAGGDVMATYVEIKKPSGGGGGTGGGNTGGDSSSSRSDDDDDKEEDRTDSKPVVVNKDVLFVSNMTGLPYGTFFVKQEQGVAAKYAFAAALQKGYKSAFTFNMITNGKKPEFTLKKGTFTLTIPPELRKAGRTFAIQALDKNGKVLILPDKDKNPDTITVDVNLEGYAFELIYKD